ncbi:MAG: hypothetical protein QNJ35_16730 [Paracoccaceae bacterium]|nr:hypothetical protein [Paracoccaceae bacterium]
MTSITESHQARPHSIRPSFAHRAYHSALDFFASFARARAAAADYEALSRLSDKQLETRGLDRTSIARHVMARHLDI